MKLASYKDGSRDGQLVVVSRDLSSAHYATGIATRLQQALDDWNFLSPQLQDLSQTLNHGKARHAFAFDPRLCLAPLPRTWLWAEADVDARDSQSRAPACVQGRSDSLGGPGEPVVLQAAVAGQAALWDLRPQLAALTGDVLEGTEPKSALDGVRLLMLANSLHQREAPPGEPANNRGAVAVACSPVAATPDELAPAWQGGRLQLDLEVVRNGKRLALANLAESMPWHLGELMALLARHQGLGAGCLVGGGLVTSSDAVPGRLVDPLRAGDVLAVSLKGRDGLSVFGTIEQTVYAAT